MPDCLAASPALEEHVLASRRHAVAIAATHRAIWRAKLILRRIYHDWFTRIRTVLADVDAPMIELGSGPGEAKTFFPNLLASDVASLPWLDFAADACTLPLADGSVGNVIMVDVLHHLAYPRRFLSEAARVLTPGGRLVMLDVFVSPLSWPVLRFLHPERTTLSIRPLDVRADQHVLDPGNPWDGDQGIARAIFWEQEPQFRKLFPQLSIAYRKCFSALLWPMSGGFGQKNRVPAFATGLLWRIDRALNRWGRYAGYRCLVAVERLSAQDESASREGVD